jgi:hypothetical protein
MTPFQLKRLMQEAQSLLNAYQHDATPSIEDRRNEADILAYTALDEEIERVERLLQLMEAGIKHLEEEESNG